MSSIRMLHDALVAPHHHDTRLYQAGEVYEIGSDLMPSWLSDAFLAGCASIPDPDFDAPESEAILFVPSIEVPAAEMVEK